MIIIILGAPGTGKGTQAKLLSDVLKINSVSTGQLLREEVSNGSEYGKIANKYMLQGKWVPSNITIEVLSKKLDTIDLNKGVIIDAFPRLIQEKQLFDMYLKSKGKKIDHVFNLIVDDTEALRRIQERRDHPDTKKTTRHDESDEITLKRIALNKSTSKEIIQAFLKENILVEVDANRSIEDIHKDILSYISKTK